MNATATAPQVESKSFTLYGPDGERLRITSRPNYPASGFTMTAEYQPGPDAKTGVASRELATLADVREHAQAWARLHFAANWGIGGSFDAFRYFRIKLV